MRIQARKRYQFVRRGAVAPLFALLIPIVMLVCGVVVNIAYMQLNKTELRVATDAAARAAGRAFSEYQDADVAIDYAVTTAGMNNVGSKPLQIRPQDSYHEIEFGTSRREGNGYGRYSFTPVTTQSVRNGTQRATAIRIHGKRDASSLGGTINMLFSGFGPFDEFSPVAQATSTQLDRDIALVLDRSGSMAEKVIDYGEYYDSSTGWTDEAMRIEYQEWRSDYDNWRYQRGQNNSTPRHCRWKTLELAVGAFLDVLDNTVQNEMVSVTSFSSGSTPATLDQPLTTDYDLIRDELSSRRIWGGTAIGEGMNTARPSIFGSDGRPYAAKTIVVLTDGNHNSGTHPVDVATTLVNNHNVIIHTITFSQYANQATMSEVARIGGGQHYHAETEDQLVDVFREIANNLPTIITD